MEFFGSKNTATAQGANNMPGTLWMFHTEGLCRKIRQEGYHVASLLKYDCLLSVKPFVKCVSGITWDLQLWTQWRI